MIERNPKYLVKSEIGIYGNCIQRKFEEMSILRSFSLMQLLTDSSKTGLYVINRVITNRKELDIFSKKGMESASNTSDINIADAGILNKTTTIA